MANLFRIRRHNAAFTLVELMVVVGIIAVLIAVLIPVIASVRGKAYDADTQSWIQQLQGAIERYQGDHKAYPGPLADSQVYTGGQAFPPGPFTSFNSTASSGSVATNLTNTRITGSENLVLGLLGGLTVNPAGPQLVYDPSQVGLGPMSLNLANPKRGAAYLEPPAETLSWRDEAGLKTGAFKDGTGLANDSIIPEFLDKYPNGPMPIIYARARRGVAQINTGTSTSNNSVVSDGTSTPISRAGTYDLSSFIGYTDTQIGEGKKIRAAEYAGGPSFPQHGLRTVTLNSSTNNPPPAGKTYIYPLDLYAYLESPQMPNSARNKDSYILISAGPDRTYGTRDDVVNFGKVGE